MRCHVRYHSGIFRGERESLQHGAALHGCTLTHSVAVKSSSPDMCLCKVAFSPTAGKNRPLTQIWIKTPSSSLDSGGLFYPSCFFQQWFSWHVDCGCTLQRSWTRWWWWVNVLTHYNTWTLWVSEVLICAALDIWHGSAIDVDQTRTILSETAVMLNDSFSLVSAEEVNVMHIHRHTHRIYSTIWDPSCVIDRLIIYSSPEQKTIHPLNVFVSACMYENICPADCSTGRGWHINYRETAETLIASKQDISVQHRGTSVIAWDNPTLFLFLPPLVSCWHVPFGQWPTDRERRLLSIFLQEGSLQSRTDVLHDYNGCPNTALTSAKL